ncbi:MAG: MFS transporter [Saprospiraceae bacterium]|nr:MFS transporter [Saprospiraceae bacterium]
MKKNDPYASLRYTEFNLFLIIRFALVFAWSMQFIIIEWEVYRLTKDPLSLGIIGLMEVIPAFSMALFAGHIVDQKEKRNLLIICTSAFLILSIGFWYLTAPSINQLLSSNSILLFIYSLVFLGGIVRAFISPTIFSLMALVVPKKLYPNAAAWSSSVWQLSAVLGPALGGFTILWMGTHGSMYIIIGFIICAILITLKISRKPIMNPKIGEPVIQSLKEGIKFVFGTKVIFGALTLDMIAVLFGGAIALLPIYAMDILHVGPEGFGIMRAAPAIGSFLTMFAVAYFPINKKAGFKLFVSIFCFGISIIVFGLSTVFWLSVLALFISGVTDGISMVIRQTILQLYTPDNMRGRVASVTNMFVGSSNELGAFESGFTAKIMGTVTAVVFGGTMTLITVTITAFTSPALRKLDFTAQLKKQK